VAESDSSVGSRRPFPAFSMKAGPSLHAHSARGRSCGGSR
jgi:hypothetical protein